jgi:ribonuclease BN (tRNA processing enzyme)
MTSNSASSRRAPARHAKARGRKNGGATKVVMLGTGTPGPDPNRSGPATAIIVGDTPYLIDFGPGVVRRMAAAYNNGIGAFGFGAANLQTAFLTHLHADHTAGYPDLLLTPWIMGRRAPLEVYGPRGLKSMTEHVTNAWRLDIANRTYGSERLPVAGSRVSVHEIKSGPIYKDANISVTAFSARHGEMKDAFGFRFDTPERSIVISGDTAPTEAIVEHSLGCDVLIHETYSQASYRTVTRKWQAYRRAYHTSSRELAAIANRAKPGLLVLYHRGSPGAIGRPNPEQVLFDEIRRLYEGEVVTGHDLDVF